MPTATTTRRIHRRAIAGVLAAGAVSAGIGLATAGPAAANVYDIAPINGVQAFGIGPFATQWDCTTYASSVKDWGQKSSPRFGTCVYDQGAGGWLILSKYAQ